MNGYKLISILVLLILVVALPAYILSEPGRMAQAQMELRGENVAEAADMYLENCAVCHGAAGEGIGATPPLNNEVLWTADYDALFKTIARGRAGTAMTGWHVEEGGVYNDYQIDELISLIRYVDWAQLRDAAVAQGLTPPAVPAPQTSSPSLEEVAVAATIAEPWAEGMQLYATNCAVCHGAEGEGSTLAPSLNTPDVRAREALELAQTISEGVPDTMMVGWRDMLSVEQLGSLVAFIQNWDAVESAGLAPAAPPPAVNVDDPAAMLALGERVYNTTCTGCHGEEGGGGIGPVLNSQQVLTNNSDDQLRQTIVNGGWRANSGMPAFGELLSAVELDALVAFLRSWEPTAPWVENPRGTGRGGGPPWLRNNG
jgi:cbb3-type cytochrome c oxidase subunit III